MEKKETYKFLVSSESLNSYGFRVLTEGIDISQYKKNPIVLFMHNRSAYNPKGDEVVGRAVKVYKEAGNLYADIEFDSEDDFAQKIEGKVSRGFIKMASVGIDPVERSSDSSHLLPGQSRPTVTKSKLKEISIVDIGSNDQALKLYDNGEQINLSTIPSLNQLKEEPDMDYQKLYNDLKNDLAKKLEMQPGGSDADLVLACGNVVTKSKEAEVKLSAIAKKENDAKDLKAVELVDKAIKLGVFPERLKEANLSFFKTNYDQAETILSYAIKKVEGDEGDDSEDEIRKEAKVFLSNLGKGGEEAQEVKNYGWYEKNDPDALMLMMSNEKEKFDKLFDAWHK